MEDIRESMGGAKQVLMMMLVGLRLAERKSGKERPRKR
jgi:hypothetical protein